MRSSPHRALRILGVAVCSVAAGLVAAYVYIEGFSTKATDDEIMARIFRVSPRAEARACP